ncbi:TetR/AcrR family transcriptional regulator [Aestuariibius sp. 2305UL40-4]|uniref:TetR/AcrR family transcriptional regulator n=1 Tax=Aestuariibius violaceus TaxID=3234132 RepID=UPI00345EA4EA
MTETKEHIPAYQRRKADRPVEILQAALEEFHAHGYAGAKPDRIAKRAGVSRSTLYLYFDNKDALFEAVAEKAMGTFVDEIAESTISFTGTTEELVRQLLERFYDMILTTKNSAMMRILIAEGPSRPELVRRYHALVIRKGHVALEKIVARGIERGEVRKSAATTVPQLLIAPALFFLIHKMVFGDLEELEVESYLTAHLDMLFNGIGVKMRA